MKTLCLFLSLLLCAGAATVTKKPTPAKPASIGEIQAAVPSAVPAYIKANPIFTDHKGRPSTLVSMTTERTEPVSGWPDTWTVSGKVKLGNGSERGYEARVSTASGIKVTDISLGF